MAEKPSMPSMRPPWRLMAITAVLATELIAGGVALGQTWLALLGAIVLGCVPGWLVVPGIRLARYGNSNGGYRDMHYFGGLLSILGFTAEERDAAFARRDPAGSESDDASPR